MSERSLFQMGSFTAYSAALIGEDGLNEQGILVLRRLKC